MSLQKLALAATRPESMGYVICAMLGSGILGLGLYSNLNKNQPFNHQLVQSSTSRQAVNLPAEEVAEKPLVPQNQVIQTEQQSINSPKTSSQSSGGSEPQSVKTPAVEVQPLSPCMSLSRDLQDSAAGEYAKYLDAKNRISATHPRNKTGEINSAYNSYKTAVSSKYRDYKNHASDIKCKPIDTSPTIQSK